MGLKHRIAFIILISAMLFGLFTFNSKAAETVWACEDSGVSKTLNSVCYGNGMFVAVGQGGTVLSSPDGEKWTDNTNEGLNASKIGGADLYSVCYGNGIFVAVGATGTIISSTDGISWTKKSIGIAEIPAVCYGGKTFLAFPTGSPCLISSNGTEWSGATEQPQFNVFSACYSQKKFVAIGEYCGDLSLYAADSADGEKWEHSACAESLGHFLKSICWSGDKFIAVGLGGFILMREGKGWDDIEKPPSDGPLLHDYYGVCSDGAGTLVAVGETLTESSCGVIKISKDNGENWIERSLA